MSEPESVKERNRQLDVGSDPAKPQYGAGLSKKYPVFSTSQATGSNLCQEHEFSHSLCVTGVQLKGESLCKIHG